MKIGAQICKILEEEIPTLNGFIPAAKASNVYSRAMWTLLSIISTIVCLVLVIEAQMEFQSYTTNVKVSVQC